MNAETGIVTTVVPTPGNRPDKAVMLALLDTGLRASEFIALNVGDIDMRTGAVMVRHEKGNKFRNVFLGGKSRRALVSYLRMRDKVGDVEPLFATIDASRDGADYEPLSLSPGRRGRPGRAKCPTSGWDVLE